MMIIRTLTLVLAFCAISFTAAHAQAPTPEIVFVEGSYDFGEIKQGEKAEHTFTYRNNGDMPLIINDVKVSCGCTATKWSETPLPPGEEAEITVVFDSAGKSGRQNKIVTIMSNAPEPVRVTMSGNVLTP